jgi:hypothetical protein
MALISRGLKKREHPSPEKYLYPPDHITYRARALLGKMETFPQGDTQF